jgi:anthranilate phosphoribosyltransferase
VFAASHVADLEGDRITEFDVDPARWGLAHRDRAGVAGGSAAESAARIRAVLAGESGAARDIVVLNTAAALVVGGVARDLEDGIARARQAIDSGAARRKLEELAAFSARE